ncbi:HEAT repeat domain-containing protein [Moellerella wisconsensis]|uniref:HEAT repeat domain-containing protein n=1 Tax=Moellerella wisconsensis TaxID=158849 RepID=UPI00092EBD53|nr:HEAT repeat domain-containing protein [Moellerella wisconsensis]VFS48313.1 HEAT repeat [Moellerella wisconsensis]
MENTIIRKLIELTHNENNKIKVTAISALGEYKAATGQKAAISRLIQLCDDKQEEVAVCAVQALGRLSLHF